MNSSIRNLKRRLMAVKQSKANIYIRYADGTCYKLNEDLELKPVDAIPIGANVTDVPVDHDDLKYLFTGVVDSKPEFTYILSVSEAKAEGIL